jgi:hypothetical protein
MKAARRGFLKALAVVPLAPRTEGTTAPPPQDLEAILTQGAERAVGGAFQGADAAAVNKAMASGQKAARALQASRALTNADEPVLVFAAHPPAAGQGSGGRS